MMSSRLFLPAGIRFAIVLVACGLLGQSLGAQAARAQQDADTNSECGRGSSSDDA